MEWSDFLVKREELLGRDLVSCEMGGYCRGPIKYIVGKKHALNISLHWIAYSRNGNDWYASDDPPVFVINMDYGRVTERDGIFFIDVPYLGTMSILRDNEHLDRDACGLMSEFL